VIQGEGGIATIPENIISLLIQLREKFGFLIIADEIQSGIGRTGKFFAYEHTSLKPDIVVCAKAVGGGLPLGAILTSEAIAETLRAGVHGTTFGGNALACVAGSVVLDQLERGLMQEVAEKGVWFKEELNAICYRHPGKIHKILGRGFMIGVNFLDSAKPVHTAFLERGFITNVTHETVLRLLPPLVATQKDLETFLIALEEVTASLNWD
jgi:acetylornithine/N-succinyldiaminopimelate aminotransferase